MTQLKTFKGDQFDGCIVIPEARRGTAAEVVEIRSPEEGRPVEDDGLTYMLNRLSADENYRRLTRRLKDLADHTEGRMIGLRNAIAVNDGEAIAASAHALTEFVGRVGAIRMMRLCIAMQMLGRRGMLDKVKDLMTELESEYRRVKEGRLLALA